MWMNPWEKMTNLPYVTAESLSITNSFASTEGHKAMVQPHMYRLSLFEVLKLNTIRW